MASWKKLDDNKYRLNADLWLKEGKRVKATKNIRFEEEPSNDELSRLALEFEREVKAKKSENKTDVKE